MELGCTTLGMTSSGKYYWEAKAHYWIILYSGNVNQWYNRINFCICLVVHQNAHVYGIQTIQR